MGREPVRAPVERAKEPDPVPGDVGALYRAHGPQVARWAARLAGPSLDAEDITQEVFLIAQRLLPGFRGEAAITTWLYRITANVVRHRRRRERIYRWFHLGEERAAEVAATGPTPFEELEKRRATALVYRALDGLAERERTVLILFELEGLSGEEIAELMGARHTTLRVWLHRARARFAARLKQMEVAR